MIPAQRNLPAEGGWFGRFQLTGKLGEGGMGVVFRAVDTEANRVVALKILKTDEVSDDETLRRLSREGRAATLLDHPNVARVLEVSRDAAWPYIASEFVEGVTLKELLAAGPMPPAKAFRYAAAMAKGLAAVHGVGLVHCDLKPANVMIGAGDTPKLVDFGIAARAPHAAAPADVTLTSTMPLPSPVGTVCYMSPEQVLGKLPDWRTDIFSLGVVLYEMLVGQRLFPGDTPLAAAANVLSVAFPGVPGLAPAPARILRRCLEKDPADRWQSAADLSAALEDAAEQLRDASSRRRKNWVFAAVAVAAFVAGYFVYAWAHPLRPNPVLETITFRDGVVTGGRFLPDGSILYSAAWHGQPSELFVQRPGGTSGRKFGMQGRVLAVNRGGQMLIVQHRYGKDLLIRAAVEGGGEKTLAENVTGADFVRSTEVVAWARKAENGAFILEERERGLERHLAGEAPFVRVSPDGQRIAYFEHIPERNTYKLQLLEPGGAVRTLVQTVQRPGGLVWLASGKEIVYAAAMGATPPNIWAVTLEGLRRVVMPSGADTGVLDLDAAGRLLFRSGASSSLLFLRDVKAGVVEQDLTWHKDAQYPTISADGAWAVFNDMIQGDANVNPETGPVFLRRTDGAEPTHLSNCYRPEISPDAKLVACVRLDFLYQQPKSHIDFAPTGAGTDKLVEIPGWTPLRVNWMSDSRRVQVEATNGAGARKLFQVTPDGRFEPLTRWSRYVEWFSADGARGYLQDGGRIVRVGLERGTEEPLCRLPEGEIAVALGDSKSPVVVTAKRAGAGVQLSRMPLDGCAAAPWQTLSHHAGSIDAIRVTPDLSKILYTVRRERNNLFALAGAIR